jgi:hypothetical protein
LLPVALLFCTPWRAAGVAVPGAQRDRHPVERVARAEIFRKQVLKQTSCLAKNFGASRNGNPRRPPLLPPQSAERGVRFRPEIEDGVIVLRKENKRDEKEKG